MFCFFCAFVFIYLVGSQLFLQIGFLNDFGSQKKMVEKHWDKHMIKMIMELVRNRSFTLTTGDSKQSRLRRLENDVPQRSVLAPLLFNIYTYDLPSMISRKFAYADDLALLHSSGNWKDLQGTLSQDMSTLSAYLQSWRLKLSHTKTVTAAFHLNN